MIWGKVADSFNPRPMDSGNTILPPFYSISDVDKQGLIIVITTFCLISVWLCLSIRFYVRLNLNGPWKWDDWWVATAVALSTARSAIVYIEVARGYGTSIDRLDSSRLFPIGKALFADNLLYILALLSSKYAIAALCFRLTLLKGHSRIIWGSIILCSISALISILLITTCPPSQHRCANFSARWIVICALDIITEVSLLSFPLYLIFRLQKLSFKLKLVAYLAFGVRMPATAFSAIRLTASLTQINSSDPILTGAFTAAWMQLQLDYSIMSSTVNCLGAFLSPFTTTLVFHAPTSRNLTANRTPNPNFHLNSEDDPWPPFPPSSFEHLKKLSNATGLTGTTVCPSANSAWGSFSVANSRGMRNGSEAWEHSATGSPVLRNGSVTCDRAPDFSPMMRFDGFESTTSITGGPRRASQAGRSGIVMQLEWEVKESVLSDTEENEPCS